MKSIIDEAAELGATEVRLSAEVDKLEERLRGLRRKLKQTKGRLEEIEPRLAAYESMCSEGPQHWDAAMTAVLDDLYANPPLMREYSGPAPWQVVVRERQTSWWSRKLRKTVHGSRVATVTVRFPSRILALDYAAIQGRSQNTISVKVVQSPGQIRTWLSRKDSLMDDCPELHPDIFGDLAEAS